MPWLAIAPSTVSVLFGTTTTWELAVTVNVPAEPSSVPPAPVIWICEAGSVGSVRSVPPRSVPPSSCTMPDTPPLFSVATVPPEVLSITPCTTSVPPTPSSKPWLLTVLVPVLSTSAPPAAAMVPAVSLISLNWPASMEP